MKTLTLLSVALCLFVATAFAQQDSAAMQKACMEYATPGPEHQLLGKGAGNWSTDLSFWPSPGSPAQHAAGNCTTKMILGDRYQESRFSGDMMGMPFEGIGTTAFDNARKLYISTWIDNMGTGLSVMEGKWDPAAKALILHGKMVDPATHQEMKVREVIRWQDDNHHTMEMYRMVNGKEIKDMEIKFTRK
ncbi:DUF1579 domain-containing protein [Chitinophaga sp. Mgbs1]|uniref:DUF1579 domain-containing protein n=1 Tax=Chitinophaga solisilvae TaxID=1233460 RepID=A0A9Q5D980_9BACT|nr:DUF1579 domain-containing protein [Chitinophaga solisilvae]